MLCGVKDGTCETSKESVIPGYCTGIETSGRHTQLRIKETTSEDPLYARELSTPGGLNGKEIHGRVDTWMCG